MAKKDLIPNSERTPEELQRMTRKGGKKSGEARRRKRDAKKLIELMLESKVPDNLKKKMHALFPDMKLETIEELMNASMLRSVVKGNVQAYNALLDRVDGKPMQKLDQTTTLKGNLEITQEMDELGKEYEDKLKETITST